MTENDIYAFLNRIVDGQAIRVTTASGRTFDGVFNAEETEYPGFLYFDTMEGKPLRAEWRNVENVDFRSARAMVGRMMVPPEHPLSGVGPVGVRSDGTPLRPHTVRNR